MKRILLISLSLAFAACNARVEPPSTATAPPAAEPAATATNTARPSTETAAAAVSGPTLTPIDEAKSDPSLQAARDELLAAVRARDAERVVALADPKIRTSFGDGGGSAALRQSLARPGAWEDLEQLLTLGGSFQGEGEARSFWAPYVYSAWPEAHDAFESLAVIGSAVPLRESSDPSAATVGMLSHNIVTRANGKNVNVKTADGKTGWVDPKQLRSPVGTRAGFVKSGDRWRMNALVSGD
jgi:hypothetical protein